MGWNPVFSSKVDACVFQEVSLAAAHPKNHPSKTACYKWLYSETGESPPNILPTVWYLYIISNPGIAGGMPVVIWKNKLILNTGKSRFKLIPNIKNDG